MLAYFCCPFLIPGLAITMFQPSPLWCFSQKVHLPFCPGMAVTKAEFLFLLKS